MAVKFIFHGEVIVPRAFGFGYDKAVALTVQHIMADIAEDIGIDAGVRALFLDDGQDPFEETMDGLSMLPV
ncbi:hypothetical protein DK853_42250, partial [Klebsiella oxytoca]